MKKPFTLLPVCLFLLTSLGALQAQTDLVVISGTVHERDNQEPLVGVSISVKGGDAGTLSDVAGNFSLKTKIKFPFLLAFNMVGFEPYEINIANATDPVSIQLEPQSILGTEVVVSASRVEESILKSPVAIEKLDIRAIRETPASSFYDALENVKGVQMLTSSITFKVPNTRGFNVPNNFRFMQLVDGVDMQAATLGVPLGNAIGPTELDIASIEITPGAASALYGMNAINGMANLTTKKPFHYQGLSVYQKVGVNHVDGIDHDPSLLHETAIRYAKAWRDKVAFKVNFSNLTGTDWVANGLVDQNPQRLGSANPRFPELAGADNPARDQWSRYGDDRQARSAITIQYKGQAETFNVARTGYLEKDLLFPNVRNIKFDAGFFYKLNPQTILSYDYRYGTMDGVFQRGNRIQLKDVVVQNHKVELRNGNLLLRGYMLIENTGNSYNLNPLAYNLDLNHATNSVWAGVFKTELQKQVDAGTDLATAMHLARNVADAGRVEPGTPEFEALKKTIVSSNNWDILANVPTGSPNGGAALWQRSRTYHFDFQYNISKIKWANILVGADYRRYAVIPDGNTFVDFSRPVAERTVADENGGFGKNQVYVKYGGFLQVTRLLLQDRLKLNASARVDNNPEFSPVFNPRMAAVYTIAKHHNIRASFQNGYRFPALFEAFSFLNNASVRRVGGLKRVNEGIGFNENSYTLASLDMFTAAVNADVATLGITRPEAALKNRDLLKIANLQNVRPESINSLEAGYKSVLFDNHLSIDFDAYVNKYSGFLGQVEVAVPKTDKVGTDASVQDMLTRSKQDRYRVYTNAKNDYISYGSSLGLSFNFWRKFLLSGNVNYNELTKDPNPDVFLTGFNTPKYVTNLTFGNREIVKNLGFNIVWRWQDHVYWESTLANGQVPAYSTIDAQVTLAVPKLKSKVKVGATNLFNRRYYQFAAGPTIGGLYYVAITYDGTVVR